MSNFTALFDSCVLYPAPLRDLLMHLAIRAPASVIVTYNLKDFPGKILEPYGIETQHPDLFLSHLIELAPERVCNAIKHLRSILKNPPIDAQEYLSILEIKQSLPQFANKLCEFIEYI